VPGSLRMTGTGAGEDAGSSLEPRASSPEPIVSGRSRGTKKPGRATRRDQGKW
jgi:hypothetical protein